MSRASHHEPAIGIVYVPALEPLLEAGNICVDVLEIEPQTFWHYQPHCRQPFTFPEYALDHIKAFPQKKIVHGVGFSPGGSRLPRKESIAEIEDNIRALDAQWASEHLSFTNAKSSGRMFHTGFMLPPLQTLEGSMIAARTIREYASRLSVPFAVETAVSYLKPRKGELTDGEFVACTVEQADCGILLDMHNIWTNEKNGRQSVKDFLASIPLERVWEIHLGGGIELDGYWLDAHSGEVPEPVLQLTQELIPRLPNLKAVIYEIFPAYIPRFGLDNVEKQLQKIRLACSENAASREEPRPAQPFLRNLVIDNDLQQCQQAAEEWEDALGGLVTGDKQYSQLAIELSADPAINLVRKLIWKFRAGSIVKVLTMLVQLVLIHSSKQTLEAMLDGYFKQTKPEPFGSEEALGFINYLRNNPPDIPYINDILSYEEGAILASLEQKNRNTRFDYNPCELLEALLKGSLPTGLQKGCFEMEISPQSP